MSATYRRPRLPLVAVLVAVTAWGVAPLLVRGIDADSSTIIFWRVLLALPVSISVAYATGGGMSWAVMRRALPTGIAFAFSIMAGFSSFRETSIANATLIPALQPALILVLASRMFGERRTRAEVAWALVAFVGVSAVVLGASSDNASLYGNLLAVANLCVFDPEHRWEVDADRLASKARNTPYAGRSLTGKVRHTILRGDVVVKDGEAQR